MPNYTNLQPHRPLDEHDKLYVPRPDKGRGEHIARMVAAEMVPIALTGPVGSGKSTELAQAIWHLQQLPNYLPVLVRLDRYLNMLEITESLVFGAVGYELFKRLKSPSALAGLSRDRILAILRDYGKKRGKSIAICVDGLEKCPQALSRQLARALFDLREEAAVVLILPPSLLVGPGAGEFLQLYDAHVHEMRALYLHGNPSNPDLADPCFNFFLDIIKQRLGPSGDLPKDVTYQVWNAAFMSGGVVRMFLQILLQAGKLAQLSERAWPNTSDFEEAIHAEEDGMRRLLSDGDVEVLRRVLDGMSDLEIPLDRRLRYLTQGLVLEYELPDGNRLVRPAPLLGRSLRSAQP